MIISFQICKITKILLFLRNTLYQIRINLFLSCFGYRVMRYCFCGILLCFVKMYKYVAYSNLKLGQ